MKRAGVWGEKTLASLTILPRRFTLAPDLSFEYGPSLACIISKLLSSAKSSICQFYEHNRRKPKFNSPAWEADSLFVRMYTFFRFRDKLYWHVSVLCICDLLPLSRSMQNIRSCSMFIRCFLRKVHRQSYDHALRGSQQFPHHMTIFPPLLGRPRLLPRPVNPFTLKSDLIDFTLSNARRFYSSKGDPLGVKRLKNCLH